MKRPQMVLIWALGVLCFVPTSLCQEAVANGVYWNQMPTAVRKMYVRGFIQGKLAGETGVLKLADALKKQILTEETNDKKTYSASQVVLDKNLLDFMVSALNTELGALSRDTGVTPSPKEISSAVDSFYNDPANLSVCFPMAVDYVWHSLDGVDMGAEALKTLRFQGGRTGCKGL